MRKRTSKASGAQAAASPVRCLALFRTLTDFAEKPAGDLRVGDAAPNAAMDWPRLHGHNGVGRANVVVPSQGTIDMGFLPSWLAQITGDSQFDASVERVARGIENTVWDSIQVEGNRLNSFQLRGYIRARSTLAISRAVEAEMGSSLSHRDRRHLTETVRETVIRQMVAKLIIARNAQMPIRAAA